MWDRSKLTTAVARAMAAAYARGAFDSDPGPDLEDKIKKYVDEHWQAWDVAARSVVSMAEQTE